MTPKRIIIIALFLSLSCSAINPAPEKEDSNKAAPVKKPTAEIIALYKEKLKKLSPQDSEGHFKLALWCKDEGLIRVMNSRLRQTIRLKPDHLQARELLGYVKQGNDWIKKDIADLERKNGLLKYANIWMLDGTKQQLEYSPAPDELEGKKRWNSAWILRTEHYLIRTNTDPDSAFQFGKTMELLYRSFFDIFDPVMTLVEPAQPLTVNIFKNQRDYAAATIGRWGRVEGNAWFWPADGINTFIFEKTYLNLFHEGSHQMAYHCMGIDPLITPHWLYEGLGEYFEAGKPENNRIKLGNINSENLTSLKTWVKQNAYIPFPKFLSLNYNEYMADERTYAEGWGLVHFLMEYQNGRYRPGFFEFIDNCRNSGGKFEDFKKAFDGIDLVKMEREWKEYILSLE